RWPERMGSAWEPSVSLGLEDERAERLRHVEARLRRARRECGEVLALALAFHAVEAERQLCTGAQRGEHVGRLDRDLDHRVLVRFVARGADAQLRGPAGIGLRLLAPIDEDVEEVAERPELDLEVALEVARIGHEE